MNGVVLYIIYVNFGRMHVETATNIISYFFKAKKNFQLNLISSSKKT